MPVNSTTTALTRSEFATADPDAAHHYMSNVYVGHRVQQQGSTAGFTFATTRDPVGEMSIDHVRHSSGTSCVTESPDQHIFLFPNAGCIEVSTKREHVRLAKGDAGCHHVDWPMTVNWDILDLFVLSLPVEVLNRVADERAGCGLAGGLRFEAMTPISRAMARYWRSTVSYVHRELVAPGSTLSSPLIQATTTDLVAIAALSTFPNTTMTLGPARDSERVAPTALRRAVAYIDAHAAEPITLTDIAAAARVGPRALQQAFTRHYDTTPTNYLRRIRLEHAHRQLQSAGATRGETVASIARRWGFAHPGRFAAAYRRQFGRTPQQTLRG
ncbi:AraC family transcriptional regulator [Micromonospora pisi]|uniref:AraC family transcriptional regulator n=1 Tax=Micromonospora pisi TaxID=589240 RepID=A0A495JGX3_9ACTN|nr:AraC family transcriptional regulator [Micromonospora pisi]RKR87634.1 AraC family transcriptional regulator [Micromonospora pisi]